MVERPSGQIGWWVRRVVAVAGLGAVTTLAIAWPIALAALHLGWTVHGLQRQAGSAWTDGSGEGFKLARSSRWLGDWYQVYRPGSSDSVLPLGEKRLLPSWVATPARPPDGETAESVTSVDTAAHGWPWRCLASESWTVKVMQVHPTSAGGGYCEVLKGNLVLGQTSRGRTIMPLRPIWPGLLADTVAWGAAWFVVLAAVSGARSLMRRRRGRCAACGYDRRGLGAGVACPECGGLA